MLDNDEKRKAKQMKVIGITGGVGAGKTEILNYIGSHYSCEIIRADEAAHMLEQPGESCYQELVALLGKDILEADGNIQKNKMAEKIFSDASLLKKVNQIIHPAVKRYICTRIAEERERKDVDYFFIEAALLIEEHYDEIVDELWYIHTDVEVREKRLMQSRNYSKEKVADIMSKQLSETVFRQHCKVVITNNGDLSETCHQIDAALRYKDDNVS